MDWTAISRLVPEIAVVVVFIWFILEREKRQDERDTKRDQLWRDFLKEERDQRSTFSTRVADEIKANTITLSAMNSVLIMHDTRTTAALGEILPSLRRIETGLVLANEADE